MAQVFISYAREDRSYARALAEVLERHAVTVWWDRNLEVGRPYADVIEQELDGTDCVIVLWSKQSIASEWVKAEASEGAARQILVPIVIQSVRMPLEFRRLHTANLVGWDLETEGPELAACIEAVRSMIGMQRTIPLTAGDMLTTVGPSAPAARGVDTEAVNTVSARYMFRHHWANVNVLTRQKLVFLAMLLVLTVALGAFVISRLQMLPAETTGFSDVTYITDALHSTIPSDAVSLSTETATGDTASIRPPVNSAEDNLPDSCWDALQQSSLTTEGGLGTGHYKLDPDGAGPRPSRIVYCDMAFDGGGWLRVGAKLATCGSGNLARTVDLNPERWPFTEVRSTWIRGASWCSPQGSLEGWRCYDNYGIVTAAGEWLYDGRADQLHQTCRDCNLANLRTAVTRRRAESFFVVDPENYENQSEHDNGCTAGGIQFDVWIRDR